MGQAYCQEKSARNDSSVIMKESPMGQVDCTKKSAGNDSCVVMKKVRLTRRMIVNGRY